MMVQDVDGSTVISAHSIDSPVLGIIAPERLSGGVKALFIMYKEPDLIVNASAGLLFCFCNKRWVEYAAI